MTESDRDNHEAVSLLRDTMRRHEHLADGAVARLLPAVQASVSNRPGHRMAWLGVAAAVVVAAGAVPAAVALLDRGGSEPSIDAGSTPGTSSGPLDPPAEGWRWESSLGLQATVPDTWAVNNFGCGQTDASSVVRGGGATTLCFTPEPPTKELAIFGTYGGHVPEQQVLADAMIAADAPRQDGVVDGVPVVRIAGQLADGRYAGVVLVPDRGASLIVRTRSLETTEVILASLRLLDVDHVGCPVQRAEVSPPTRSGDNFVDPSPVSIAVCHYGAMEGQADSGRLLASIELTGDDAISLATLMNRAPAGGNPDVPADQCLAQPTEPDAVLYVHSGDGSVERVWVQWSDCLHRGLSNGAAEAQVSKTIVAAIMNPLHIGYGFSDDLPA
jgi:hypothetical protein